MKRRNALLNYSIVFCEVFRFIFIALGVLLFAFFVHIQVNPSFYEDYYCVESPKGNEISKSMHFKIQKHDEIEWKEDTKAYKVNSITNLSLYYNTLRFLAIFTLLYLAILEFERVIESVKDFTTFRTRNVKAFRRIGTYLLVILILSTFNYFAFGDLKPSIFKIEFTNIFQVLIAFIFAEIFKEGNKLYEENQLTV